MQVNVLAKKMVFKWCKICSAGCKTLLSSTFYQFSSWRFALTFVPLISSSQQYRPVVEYVCPAVTIGCGSHTAVCRSSYCQLYQLQQLSSHCLKM